MSERSDVDVAVERMMTLTGCHEAVWQDLAKDPSMRPTWLRWVIREFEKRAEYTDSG